MFFLKDFSFLRGPLPNRQRNHLCKATYAKHECLSPGNRKRHPPRTEKERTNKPDTQERSPTQPRQLRPRPKKATAKQRESNQATSANKNERTGQTPKTEALLYQSISGQDPRKPRRSSGRRSRRQARTRTNKNKQERTRGTNAKIKKVEPRSKAPPSPSDQGHREQGSGKRLGSRREVRAPPSPSDLARLQQGPREQGSGQQQA